MDITVLGNGAAYPRPGGACSGLLVSNEDTNVWIDAGNGTFSRLLELISLAELDALVLTHAHADHIADVSPLMYAIALGGDVRNGALPIYVPKQMAAASVGVLLGGHAADTFQRVFEMHAFNGAPVGVGTLSLEPFRTLHPGETYGIRVRSGDRTAVYTSDTAFFPELPDACRDADLLICEATYVDEHKAEPGVHMWAKQAGTVASKAGVKRLVLTHILPAYSTEQAVHEAAAEYDGPVEAAVEGKRYSI